MSRYESESEYVEAAPEEPDPRIIALHRVIDLERQYNSVSREAEDLQKRQSIVREELSEARDELNGALGLPSNAKASDPNRYGISIGMTR
jgi:hypothetical protein